MNDEELRDWLAECKVLATALRSRLVTAIIPATVSPTAKTAFKVRVAREVLLHRVSDLCDAACDLHDKKSTIPAFVLTRAALETMAVLYYVRRSVHAAIQIGSVEALDAAAMKQLFGSKDGSTPHDAVNILTAVGHVEKQYPGVEDLFKGLCEFAHPNLAGVLLAYQRLEGAMVDDPTIPVTLGRGVSAIDPSYGHICLSLAIRGSLTFADQLAGMDAEVVRLCESEMIDGPSPASATN